LSETNDGDAAWAARHLEMQLGLVQAAIAYYGAYTDDINQQIEASEQETAEAHSAFTAGQDAVRRSLEAILADHPGAASPVCRVMNQSVTI
jgi:hypothetical protein